MAKIYTKGVWVDEVLAGDETYEVRNDADVIVYNDAKIELSSGVAVAGSPVNASRMNNIENGIDGLDDLIEAINTGNWVAGGTWTYVSAVTFTVPGDQTAIFTVGRRIKWTQTSVKYGVVVSSSYGSPNTTVTIEVNTAYIITNAAISANYYSFSSNPASFPNTLQQAPDIHVATNKTTPVDADEVGFWDSVSGLLNHLTWANLKATAIAAIQAASDTVAGIVELATSAEVITGTDTARAVTPAGLQAKVASTTVKGISEIATAAEINTGTDADRVISPDSLAGSNLGIRYVSFALNGSGVLTTSEVAYWRVPAAFTGMNLVSVAGSNGTGAAGASSSGNPTFTVTNVTDAQAMLSTSLTIDATEYTSASAATPAVIDDAHDDVVTDDLIKVAVTTSGTGTTYAVVTLGFQLP